uniref:Uncharacterized protein n=1 Tax=Rhizophora mucronata TaxID=61149 RepID=A0A2P2PRJ4_RHIMU
MISISLLSAPFCSCHPIGVWKMQYII